MNGALWTREQFEEAERAALESNNKQALAALAQVRAMLIGVEAWKRAIEVERSKRCEYEVMIREVKLVLRQPRSKLNKPGLNALIKAALVHWMGLSKARRTSIR